MIKSRDTSIATKIIPIQNRDKEEGFSKGLCFSLLLKVYTHTNEGQAGRYRFCFLLFGDSAPFSRQEKKSKVINKNIPFQLTR